MKILKVKAHVRNNQTYIRIYDHGIEDYVELTPEEFGQLYIEQSKLNKSRKKILTESYKFDFTKK